MKQVVQSYRTGELYIEQVPVSMPKSGHILVCTVVSLLSVGTENYMLELAKKSLLGKALARPDLVRQVLAKAQAEGILEAWREPMEKLQEKRKWEEPLLFLTPLSKLGYAKERAEFSASSAGARIGT